MFPAKGRGRDPGETQRGQRVRRSGRMGAGSLARRMKVVEEQRAEKKDQKRDKKSRETTLEKGLDLGVAHAMWRWQWLLIREADGRPRDAACFKPAATRFQPLCDSLGPNFVLTSSPTTRPFVMVGGARRSRFPLLPGWPATARVRSWPGELAQVACLACLFLNERRWWTVCCGSWVAVGEVLIKRVARPAMLRDWRAGGSGGTGECRKERREQELTVDRRSAWAWAWTWT
ncbi:hypothetical protein IWX90DRAFT_93024 [Phyllosticta citrichinensis]|uniref:Uncharacterized protein n=1 Tax=Phyllosticta citrichinensis TaxID=1130410 RepID=A0ABR1XF94_9PEZI